MCAMRRGPATMIAQSVAPGITMTGTVINAPTRVRATTTVIAAAMACVIATEIMTVQEQFLRSVMYAQRTGTPPIPDVRCFARVIRLVSNTVTVMSLVPAAVTRAMRSPPIVPPALLAIMIIPTVSLALARVRAQTWAPVYPPPPPYVMHVYVMLATEDLIVSTRPCLSTPTAMCCKATI